MRVDGGEADCAGYLARRVAQHPSRDAIQAGEIGDRIQHADIAGADIGGNVTRRHARDHHFRQTDRQLLHGRRDDGGAAGAAQAKQGGDIAARQDKAFESGRHGGDRLAAAGAEDRAGARRMVASDLFWADIGRGVKRQATGGEIDGSRG